MARELTERRAQARPAVARARAARRAWPVERKLLLALCALAFLRGLLYAVLIPPWEHYDEPTHFEYAALIARSGGLPPPETTDPALRYAIARSMDAFSTWGPGVGAYNPRAPLPNIGVSQTGHQPLYYLLASLPVGLALGAPVEVQLYAARAFSVLLMVLTLLLAAALLRLALPRAPALRLVVLSVMALTPSFGALMSAVSNDVLTSLAGVALLLIGALVLRSGWGWRAALLTLFGLALPFVVKRTIFTMAFLPLLALVMVAPPVARRWLWRGAGMALVALVAVVLLGPWGGSYWVNPSDGRLPATVAGGAFDGQRALLLRGGQVGDGQGIGQPLSGPAVFSLRGKLITSGVWARALHGQAQVLPPTLGGAKQVGEAAPITLDEHWRFIRGVARVSPEANYLELRLAPPVGSGEVLYDAAVVAQGAFDASANPTLAGADAVTWGDKQARNWVRNPSLEQQVPAIPLPSSLFLAVRRSLPMGDIDQALSTMGDTQFLGAIYPEFLPWLVHTFWLTTGRGLSVEPFGVWSQVVLALTLLAGLGWGLRGGTLLLARWRPALAPAPDGADGRVMALVWAGAAIVWATAILRVHLQPPDPSPLPYLPVGRYAFAGFLPTVLLLAMGLQWLLPARLRPALLVALPLTWVALDMCSLATNMWYYYAAR